MSEELISNFLKQAFILQEERHYKQAIEALYKALCIESDNIEILSQISNLYYLMSNFDRALDYAEKIMEINPDHVDTLSLLVNIHKVNKKYAKALSYAERLYKLAPRVKNFVMYLEMLTECKQYNTILAVIEDAKLRYDEKKNEKLMLIEGYARLKLNQVFNGIFQEVIRFFPENTDAKFYLGVIYYNKQQFDEAEKLFLSILDDIQCDRTYNYLGMLKLDQNKIGEAINYFQFALKIQPNSAFYYYNLGSAYSLNGWLFEAEQSFQSAVALEPENIVYSYSLAYLYYERHDLKKSNEVIENILSIDASHVDTLILKSMILAKNGKIVDAKNQLIKLSETETENDFLYYALAKIYKEFPLYEEAIDSLQEALFIKPDSLEYLSELADCYCETGEYSTAHDILTKVLYLNKRFIYAHLLMAKMQLAQKNYSAASKIISNAIKLDNSSAEAYKYQSMIFAAQGLKNRSIESAKTALSLNPNDHKYYAHLAKLYYDIEEYENAFLYYKEASMLDDMNTDYLYKAACAADKNNDVTNSSNYFSYALRLDPFNNLFIYEYVDMLRRRGKVKQALTLLKIKISTVDSQNVAQMLQQKYDEIKESERVSMLSKLENIAKKIIGK